MSFDIGAIPDLITISQSDKNKTIDDYERNRGFPAKYRFFSDKVVCYYHNKCDCVLEKYFIVATVQAIETYITKIGTLFSLPFPRLQQGKRFPLYISNTGLHPEPGDCVNGVVGAASDYMMILHPDVIKNIEKDQTVIIHELGHGFFSLGGIQTWIEESLCEFLTWVFVPGYQSFYDTARDSVFKKSWINPLSTTNKPYETRYNVAIIWAFIGNLYGNNRIGEIANNAFKNQDPNKHGFELLAEYLKTPVNDLALKWALACINLSFFTPSIHGIYIQKYFAGKGFTKKTPITWNISSFTYDSYRTNANGVTKRTELYGFEVSDPVILTTPIKPPTDGVGKWIVRYLVYNSALSMYEALLVPKGTQTCRILMVRGTKSVPA